MIILKDVTLFGIDCVDSNRAINAMAWSCRHVQFAEVVLLTDTVRHLNLRKEINDGVNRIPIRIIHHVETDRKVSCPNPDHYLVAVDYEMASLREPSQHVKTSHLLYQEWDSGVANPWAWDMSWLKYDFIGAPWPPHHEPGWPPCDGHTNNVGNGGFSLRSVKFCKATREATEIFKGDPGLIISDSWSSRTIRHWLENHGIKFAPEVVAARFSCENLPYSGNFGWHGKWTMELNNWGGGFAKVRP